MRKYVGSYIVLLSVLVAGCADSRDSGSALAIRPAVTPGQVSRVTTAVPFPRGLAMRNGLLYVLSRGRVRDVGGTDVKLDDQAGTIWAVDQDVGEALGSEVSEKVRTNATVFAAPTVPPFRLLDRTKASAMEDEQTDRPYCCMRYSAITASFYLCAFSGIDKPLNAEGGYFRKNHSDAVLRYDTKSKVWSEVWRGMPLDGPDNCLVVGERLFVVTKENSKVLEAEAKYLGRQDLREVAGSRFDIRGLGEREYTGHSMLAHRDGYIYLGFRTSSTVIRVRMEDLGGDLRKPVKADLVAQFDPYEPETKKTADLTDMAFGPDGDLFVVSAKPARVFRFRPDPKNVFDGRTGARRPWANLSELTQNPKMKCENLLVDDRGRVYVTSADILPVHGSSGIGGVVYRIDAK